MSQKLEGKIRADLRRDNYANWWQGDQQMKSKRKEEKRKKNSVPLNCVVELWRKEMVCE